MKWLVTPLIIILVLSTGFIVYLLSDPKRSLDNVLRNFVLHSKTELPTMINPSVLWQTLESEKKHLIYSYKILNITQSEIDIDIFEKRIRNYIQNTVCQDKAIIKLLKRGVTVIYQYYDKNHIILAKINIKAADCGL